MFQFGFNMFPEIPRPFDATYQCFSVAMLPGNERQDVERGGKIIMPPSALEKLTRLNINYPMLFKLTNKKSKRETHSGVLEFVADEGKIYLPLWMMHNMALEEGDLVQIESVSLPVGTFSRFQPLSSDFLDITNPTAVLENCLRSFACLTKGDIIAVQYNQKVYELMVLETKPGDAISIIECDMNVEFAAPVGYKEPEAPKKREEEMSIDPSDLMPEPSGFVAFKGAGNRLDGKKRKDSSSAGITLRKLASTVSLSQGSQLCPIVVLRTYYTVKRKLEQDENFLSKHLYNKIKAKGPITVADYMKDVLQNPTKGYYMCKDMFGEMGDFITSPEISQIFGEMLAVWFLNEWHKIGSPKPLQIVELGPGRGTLSSDILKVFSHFKALHKSSLHLVEISPVLSDLQSKTLCVHSNLTKNPKCSYYREGTSHHGIPVYWHRQLRDVPEGFTLLLAHEFFDALPIHKFHKTYAGYKEVLIDLETTKPNEEIRFRYVLARQDTPMLKVLLKSTETRDHVEISPEGMLIYEQICKRLIFNGGIALICDYGHNGSGTDTFRAFKKHKQVDPLIYPGTADLTADVDFNIIKEVANKHGDVIFMGPIKQRSFLHRIGIEYRVNALTANMKDKKQIDNLKQCYNFLTDDSKMGERFKFCTLLPSTLKKILDKYPVVGFA